MLGFRKKIILGLLKNLSTNILNFDNRPTDRLFIYLFDL